MPFFTAFDIARGAPTRASTCADTHRIASHLTRIMTRPSCTHMRRNAERVTGKTVRYNLTRVVGRSVVRFRYRRRRRVAVVVILQIELGLGDALVPAAGASGGAESTRGDDKDGRRRGDATDAEVRQ